MANYSLTVEPAPIADEVPTRTTWREVLERADQYTGGDLKLIDQPGSGKETILRGPLIDFSYWQKRICFNPAWIGKQVPNESGDIWFNSPLTYNLGVDIKSEVFIFNDGRVMFEIPRIVRGTIFPKGRSDRLDPEMVQNLPKGWERLLNMCVVVRDRIAINYEMLERIACSAPFITVARPIVQLQPEARIGDLLKILILSDVDKELMLKLYLGQIIGDDRVDSIVY